MKRTACSEGEVVRSLEPFTAVFNKHRRFMKQKMLVHEKIHVVMIFLVVNMHSHIFQASVKTSPKTHRGMQDTFPSLKLKEVCSLTASFSGFSPHKF